MHRCDVYSRGCTIENTIEYLISFGLRIISVHIYTAFDGFLFIFWLKVKKWFSRCALYNVRYTLSFVAVTAMTVAATTVNSNEGSCCEEHRNCWTKLVSFGDSFVRSFVRTVIRWYSGSMFALPYIRCTIYRIEWKLLRPWKTFFNRLCMVNIYDAIYTWQFNKTINKIIETSFFVFFIVFFFFTFVCLFDFHFSDFNYLNCIVNDSTVLPVVAHAFNLKFNGKLVESLLFSLFSEYCFDLYIIYLNICVSAWVCVCWLYILFNRMNYLLF